jgi:cytochrome c oxidase assembly protein subunit 11
VIPVQANRKLARKLVLAAAGMFAFGVFAMPPLYDRFCEWTGIGQAGVRVAVAAQAPPTDGSGRTVKLLFDATTNSALPWHFEPVQKHMLVTLGEPAMASYTVTNREREPVAGRAVYNVSPPDAARYFVKTECFCFSRQELAAGEQREMPVRFYLDPDLPEDIGEITLSYTFFLNQEQPGSAGLAPGS